MGGGVYSKRWRYAVGSSHSLFLWLSQVGRGHHPTESAFDEAIHLTVNDMVVDHLLYPNMLKVCLKASKTDHFQAGVDIFIGKPTLCPVAATLDYLVVVRGSSLGLLFKFEDGRPLTRGRFVEQVRKVLTAAGVDSSPYSGHSFQIGAATEAEAGIGDATIKMLGRW